MVPENKVVPEFDHPLHIVRVMLLEEEKKLGLHGCLVVVFLLILDKFDCHQFLVLVVQALDYLAKCALTDDFDQLESVCDVVAFLHAIVTLFIVKSVVDQSFKFRWLNLILIFCQIIELLVLIHLGSLEIGKILGGDLIAFGS